MTTWIMPVTLMIQLCLPDLFNRDLNRGCLVYMFSLRFYGGNFVYVKFVRVSKIFRTQVFAGIAVFSFCV